MLDPNKANRTCSAVSSSETTILGVIDKELYKRTLLAFHKKTKKNDILCKRLESLSMFYRTWAPEIQQQLADASTFRKYSKGARVYCEGERVRNVMIILEGEVDVIIERKSKNRAKKRERLAKDVNFQSVNDDNSSTGRALDVDIERKATLNDSVLGYKLCREARGSFLGDVEIFGNLPEYGTSATVKSSECLICDIPKDSFLQLAKLKRATLLEMKDNAKEKKKFLKSRFKDEKKKDRRRAKGKVSPYKDKKNKKGKDIKNLNSMSILDKIRLDKIFSQKDNETMQLDRVKLSQHLRTPCKAQSASKLPVLVDVKQESSSKSIIGGGHLQWF